MTRAAAFFDLDRTLIRGSANFPLAVAAFRAGYVPPRDLLRDALSAVRFIALGQSFIPKIASSVLPEARLALERHAAAGDDLSRCTAYSDSISDLPFLQAVGNPIAINADKELRAHAASHGWRTIAVAKPTLRKSLRMATA